MRAADCSAVNTATTSRSDTSSAAFLQLVSGRRGHFRLESGHHGALWLDLDPLFADHDAVAPFVDALVDRLRPYGVAAICGPLQGGAFLAQRCAAAIGGGAEFWFTERQLPGDAPGLFRVRYALPPALAQRAGGTRVAIVDDVMSAGSALRGTYTELTAHGADVVAAGALMVLGTTGADYFAQQQVPVEHVCREMYELWTPLECPLCASGSPLEDVIGSALNQLVKARPSDFSLPLELHERIESG